MACHATCPSPTLDGYHPLRQFAYNQSEAQDHWTECTYVLENSECGTRHV